MDFFTIGSGSSGNCSFVRSNNTSILVDAGISGKRTIEALGSNDISLEDIDAIIISHEHRDHISCLGVLLRKHPMPVYATEGTIRGIFSSDIIGEVDKELFHSVKYSDSIKIGDLDIGFLPISHDAYEPCAFRIEGEGESLGIVTDLGKYDDVLISELKDLSGILIESNHDVRMLETGIYPYHLKKRIAGNMGHLSNEDCGRLLAKLLHNRMKWILLGHLSAENNYDKLARESVGLEIALDPCPYRPGDFPIHIAERKRAMDMLKL